MQETVPDLMSLYEDIRYFKNKVDYARYYLSLSLEEEWEVGRVQRRFDAYTKCLKQLRLLEDTYVAAILYKTNRLTPQNETNLK